MIEQSLLGEAAKSLTGRDTGSIYLVINDMGSSVMLSDGRGRGAANPKKKNKKHIQVIHIDNDDLKSRLNSGLCITNEEIRECLRMM